MVMKIVAPEGNRFDIALELLREGRSFSLSNVQFWIDRDNRVLSVSVTTRWELGNLTKEIGSSEIEHGRDIYQRLLATSDEFREIVKGYLPRFSLIHDYGTGCVEIGSLLEEQLIWNL